ncbi:aa3-type cytochrome oxidase subunit IV [Corynebacterium uberis]|uniref:aa3-type cytochrome oxidase subunit IV n=1 Tax=Corynebacterium TaxID=1716 RepID=UPI001D09DAD5|nr:MULTISPECIES: cytochrome c oxidase subunit 4 [Corynebacterium]MCZ9308277.1 cytochrome c oxidase subunit 4 [Corynebacterium sp. c6VSa_13]UDL73956.1 cytochrome c oxidase subunit 4 [Corynebacterium uberis]UDL75161.1 cytochrome c oxidase subunit 4 [Corynebacterium uberis]UDL77372.1 cytochrome c oxidase subunit 4 [Corynebacterium uberis]UDL79657.1 cytochrome c oxidase subunit 4 [Corynebacterium uberis]
MKASAKIMYGLTAFLALMAVIYIFATIYVQDDGYLFGAEWVGIVCLILSTGLAIMLGGYFHFTERRTDILPEDWEEAEVSDKAGVLGFFSPNSIWPFAMSMAILVLGLGVIYLHYYLIAVGAVLLIYTGTMMNLQYGLPKEKH